MLPSQKYFAFVTNVEYWQLIVRSGESFQSCTPRALIFPRMMERSESNFTYWKENHSDIIQAMYTILHQSLSEKPKEVPGESSGPRTGTA